jgi:fanconi-associated nuclease 1
MLKEYDEENKILRALLAQSRWRRGRRGIWYDRIALILMNHRGKSTEAKWEALDVVKEALEDPYTHLGRIPPTVFNA